MRNLHRSAPVVLAAVLLLVITLPAGAAITVDGPARGWMDGLLTWFLEWDLAAAVAGDASGPGELEDPLTTDGTDSSDTLTSSPPEEGSNTEGSPYVDPNG